MINLTLGLKMFFRRVWMFRSVYLY